MLATALSKIEYPASNYFAAGVSNSTTTNKADFNREIFEIKQFIKNIGASKITYFSSFVAVNGDSPYAEHKRTIEKLITEQSFDFNIIRLPQVVGITLNQTLVSYFVQKVAFGQTINIEQNARRRLISIDDVVRISDLISRLEKSQITINIGPHESFSAIEIAKKIADILCLDLNFQIVSGGDKQDISLTEEVNILSPNDLIFSNNYQQSVLEKYVPIIYKENYDKRHS